MSRGRSLKQFAVVGNPQKRMLRIRVVEQRDIIHCTHILMERERERRATQMSVRFNQANRTRANGTHRRIRLQVATSVRAQIERLTHEVHLLRERHLREIMSLEQREFLDLIRAIPIRVIIVHVVVILMIIIR